jgi:hypothetical protein
VRLTAARYRNDDRSELRGLGYGSHWQGGRAAGGLLDIDLRGILICRGQVDVDLPIARDVAFGACAGTTKHGHC